MTTTHTEKAQNQIKDFVSWAQDQARILDKKIDAAAAEASLAGAKASAEAKQDWRKAQAALEEERKLLAKQVGDLTAATESEMKDIEAATKKSISDLGRKAEDFKRMIGRAVGTSH